MFSFSLYLLLCNALFGASYFLLWPDSPWLFAGNALLLFILLSLVYFRQHKREQRLVQSLKAGLLSLKDGDFSVSLPESGSAQNNQLIQLFNQVTDKLRLERQHLYQRELLLDKVTNASNVLTVLVNSRGSLIFTNLAARHYFLTEQNASQLSWDELLQQQAPELQQAISNPGDSLVTLTTPEGQQQSWHLSCSSLTLHGEPHQLYLLKPMTEELNRHEIETWKKVVRVINHELNNSIAPISSMCHSGLLLAEKLDEPRLQTVFSTISRRAKHLSEFIKSYSQLAKVEKPELQSVDCFKLLQGLQQFYHFELISPEGDAEIEADPKQLEQVLINLIKNATEAAADNCIEISLAQSVEGGRQLKVRDHGPGIPDELLPTVLLPYVSTKKSGSGLGLALCRDIMEAHGGQVLLNNHADGGVEVVLTFPQ